MADLKVLLPDLLEAAKELDEAADIARAAKHVAAHAQTEMERTWGPVFRGVLDQFELATHNRQQTAGLVQEIRTGLAKQVRKAVKAYADSDTFPA
ncbi:MAG: ESX-1 secretion-associated protein [Mycobacteriaceae bacterium]|nr:ESX-1 secretion-associated protein [Mycobacteriaceae bacterium]